MDTLWLILRLVLSLALVLGLIWGLARIKKRVSPTNAGTIQVLSKIPVSRKGSLLVVEVGGKKLVIGATDSSISLISEIDIAPETLEIKEERRPVELDSYMIGMLDSPESMGFDLDPAEVDALASLKKTQSDSKLAGSVLSPDTWRQLAETLREKTVRS
jgi:flagellar protein FliO/FliZ